MISTQPWAKSMWTALNVSPSSTQPPCGPTVGNGKVFLKTHFSLSPHEIMTMMGGDDSGTKVYGRLHILLPRRFLLLVGGWSLAWVMMLEQAVTHSTESRKPRLEERVFDRLFEIFGSGAEIKKFLLAPTECLLKKVFIWYLDQVVVWNWRDPLVWFAFTNDHKMVQYEKLVPQLSVRGFLTIQPQLYGRLGRHSRIDPFNWRQTHWLCFNVHRCARGTDTLASLLTNVSLWNVWTT